MDDALRRRLDTVAALLAGCFLVLLALGLQFATLYTVGLLLVGVFVWTVGGEYVGALYYAR
ncbi:hypothetical protein BRC72_02285 [Halobacteriales archaeon QH_7_66_36]|nr:MAG: hypothetical protein BRC72_02285 [Halobacteriales archaeon QH_7_66_36]